MSMRRLAINTTVVLAIFSVLVLLWQFRSAVVLFVLGVMVAAAVRPLSQHLRERGMSKAVALLVLYGLTIATVVLAGYGVSNALLNELQRAGDDLSLAYEDIANHWPNSDSGFQRAVARQLPPPNDFYNAMAGERGDALAQGLLYVTQLILDALSQLVIVLVLSIYWSLDHERIERLWLSVLPAGRRARARSVWQAIETGVGAYIRSELVQSLLAGVLLMASYWTIGLPYPALLGLFGALVWLLPWVGVVLAVIPAVLVGLTISWPVAALAVLTTVGVFMLLEVIVEPRIFKRRRYSSMLILLLMLALGDSLGLLGLIVAPPLAVATQIFFSRMLHNPPAVATLVPAQQVAELEQRLAAVELMLDSSGAAPPPELRSVISRLGKLLTDARPSIPESEAAAAETPSVLPA